MYPINGSNPRSFKEAWNACLPSVGLKGVTYIYPSNQYGSRIERQQGQRLTPTSLDNDVLAIHHSKVNQHDIPIRVGRGNHPVSGLWYIPRSKLGSRVSTYQQAAWWIDLRQDRYLVCGRRRMFHPRIPAHRGYLGLRNWSLVQLHG